MIRAACVLLCTAILGLASGAESVPEPETGNADLEAELAKAESETKRPPFSLRLGQVGPLAPELSVILDFLGQYQHGIHEGYRKLDLREVELGLYTPVGSFGRFDAFLGIHRKHTHHHDDHGEGHEHHHHEEESPEKPGSYDAHLEEAYLTLTTLPMALTARGGRFKTAFGWANMQHPHSLPWVDFPLVIQTYFGDHGLFGDGAEVSWLAPWSPYTELSYAAVDTHRTALLAGEESDGIAHVLHLKNFFDISPSATFEAGLSGATAKKRDEHASGRIYVEGIDLTYKWRPVARALYRSFTWRTEALVCQQEAGSGSAWGLYTAPEYQFARRWSVAARLDYVQQPQDTDLHAKGASAYVTFHQSEQCFWRLGVERTDRNFEQHGNNDVTQFLLQFNIGIGPHRAHKY